MEGTVNAHTHKLGAPDFLRRSPLNCPQVHLEEYGSVEEAYLAGKRHLSTVSGKITNQNAPHLMGGKVGAGAPGCPSSLQCSAERCIVDR